MIGFIATLAVIALLFLVAWGFEVGAIKKRNRELEKEQHNREAGWALAKEREKEDRDRQREDFKSRNPHLFT